MVSHTFEVPNLDALARLAEEIAAIVRPGDLLALKGELGTGKTAFARALIQSLLGGAGGEEIPSPTFSLHQTYATPRMPVHHFDFYRLADPSEALELGVEDALNDGLTLIEWPERAPGLLPEDRFEFLFEDRGEAHGADGTRHITLTGHGTASARLARLQAMNAFLGEAGWGQARRAFLQGDASSRAYIRLAAGERRAVLMDAPRQPDGPPVSGGRPYSALAHLAEDIRPFVAIAEALRGAGLSVPEIDAADLDNGFLLLEDMGSRGFMAEAGGGRPLAEFYGPATDVLVMLRRAAIPAKLSLPDGTSYRLPDYDQGALTIEVKLVIDWYWPAVKGDRAPDEIEQDFLARWTPLFDRVLSGSKGWVLRDYHSPNLFVLEGSSGAQNIGVIDFQDAVSGHAAYDLAALLQDARLDVPAALEAELFARYCEACAAQDPSFELAEFETAYAILGAQRNTKILGIFARLAVRDHKRNYLQHMPRIWSYLGRNLQHPDLAELKTWFDRHFPSELRGTVPGV
ncbi:tRNA threonylcarbamoyladenosine biosynthesis protein TsaE [bacterium MnTg02]|nr:tRNA threonylcarbamoyladenosine biosynthesis protein TsaE [bacterium MnTg02]